MKRKLVQEKKEKEKAQEAEEDKEEEIISSSDEDESDEIGQFLLYAFVLFIFIITSLLHQYIDVLSCALY